MRIIPEKGEVSTIFSRLLDYINSVDKEWKEKIKPTTNLKIEKLIKVSQKEETGYPLPEAYIEYLKKMGECDGDLLVSNLHLAKTDINTIYNNYKEMLIEQDPDDLIDPNMFIFAYNTECSSGYYIKTIKDGNHIIVSGEERNKCDYFVENFEKLLFQTAYKKYESKYFNHERSFCVGQIDYEVYEKQELKNIITLLKNNVMEQEINVSWISDKNHLIMFSNEFSIGIYKEFNIYGTIYYNYEKDFKELYKNVEKYFCFGQIEWE